MKTLFIATAILMSSCAVAQLRPQDKTLDINYTATYRSAFSMKWSGRLAESQDWSIRSFNAGGAYNISGPTSRLALTYDLWRSGDINSAVYKRYGVAFSSQSKFSNLSLSLFQVDLPNQSSGFQGRIDLNMKFQ